MSALQRLLSHHTSSTTRQTLSSGTCTGRTTTTRSRHLHVRANYEVDTDAPRRAPEAPPGRWSAPRPPPPPPPPQRPQTTGFQLPNRREALFGFLGLGLGVGGTVSYYNNIYDMSDEALENALDALMDDPDFKQAVADDLLFDFFESQVDDKNEQLDAARDKYLRDLKSESEAQQK